MSAHEKINWVPVVLALRQLGIEENQLNSLAFINYVEEVLLPNDPEGILEITLDAIQKALRPRFTKTTKITSTARHVSGDEYGDNKEILETSYIDKPARELVGNWWNIVKIDIVDSKREISINALYTAKFDKDVILARKKHAKFLEMDAGKYYIISATEADEATRKMLDAELKKILAEAARAATEKLAKEAAAAAAKKALAAELRRENAATKKLLEASQSAATAGDAVTAEPASALPQKYQKRENVNKLPEAMLELLRELSLRAAAARRERAANTTLTLQEFYNTLREVRKDDTSTRDIPELLLYIRLAREHGWEIQTEPAARRVDSFIDFDEQGNVTGISADKALLDYFKKNFLWQYSTIEEFIRDNKPKGKDNSRAFANEDDIADITEYLVRANERAEPGLETCVLFDKKSQPVLIKHVAEYAQKHIQHHCLRMIPSSASEYCLSNEPTRAKLRISGRSRDVVRIVVRDLWLMGPEYIIPGTSCKVGDVIFRGHVQGQPKSNIFVDAEQLDNPQMYEALRELVRQAEKDIREPRLRMVPAAEAENCLAYEAVRERLKVGCRLKSFVRKVMHDLWQMGPEHIIPGTSCKVGDVIFRGHVEGQPKPNIFVDAEQLENPEIADALRDLTDQARTVLYSGEIIEAGGGRGQPRSKAHARK